MIAQTLHIVAGRAKWCLMAGLGAGLLLPDLARLLRPWLPELVALLLFLTAMRIGLRAAIGGLHEARNALMLVFAYQMVLPLAALGVFSTMGVAETPLAIALVLMLAAPSVTGAPNFAILLGHDPAPAMRMLILGTALFPLTVLPVLSIAPGLGGAGEVLVAAARLFLVIAGAVLAGFATRALLPPRDAPRFDRALDGASALALGVVVIGLMAALGPALAESAVRVAGWLVAAVCINFGLQALAALVLGRHCPATAALSVVAGNRNIALFLVALPAAQTDPLLVFIGCYQVPMYLTPLLMGRFYGKPKPIG